MKKRILSLLLCLVLCLSLLPTMAFATEPTKYNDGGGDGTQATPWLIKNLDQLNDLADAVNGEGTYAASGANDMDDKYFKLTADIGSASAPFTKVIGKNPGDIDNPHFAGNFDGDGHSVYLNIAVESSSVSDEFAGMFGLREATISNLTVKGTVSANNTTANAKHVYAGGIAGWANYSTFDNCRSECTVTAQKSGTTGYAYAGGICGYSSNSNTVVNCSSSGSVTATGGKSTYAGGIAGYNSNSNMTNGGSKIKNSFSNAAVTANESSFSFAGGIAGDNYNNSSSSSNISIIANCYYSGSSVSGDTNTTGGVCGSVFHATVTNSYYDSTVLTGKTAVGGETDTADVKGLPTTDMKAASGTTGALVDLLNGYKEGDPAVYPTDFKTWTVSSGNYPLFTGMTPPVTDYGITVNDVSVTETNKTNVLNDGKVSYNPAENKLSVDAFGSNLTIVGNGTVDIEIDGGTDIAVYGDLTVKNANNVTVICDTTTNYTIVGKADITCTGDLNISNPKNGAVYKKLTVYSAKNVTVSGDDAGGYTVLLDYGAEINCTGDVKINADGKASSACYGDLTIKNAVNVTVKGYNTSDISVNCTGAVLLQNSGNRIGDDITITGATDVTMLAESSGSVVNDMNITCTGDVLLKNTHSNGGPTVYGTLTVTGARNVTAEATYDGSVIYEATTISCTGDVNITNHGAGEAVNGNLTVTGAKNVNVIGAWKYAIRGNADITSSGNVLVKNTGSGKAVYGTVSYKRMTGAGGYAVRTGDTEAALTTVAAKAESEAYSAESCEKKIFSVEAFYTVDYNILVNDTLVTDANTADVLGDGKVSYDPTEDELTVGAFDGNLTIVGNGTVDIELDGGTDIAVYGKLTVTKAADVTVTAATDVDPTLCGAVSISCSRDVTINNTGTGFAVNGSLTVNGAENVTVSAASDSPTITTGTATIDCTGNITLKNTGTGMTVSGPLTVTGAKNVTVTSATTDAPVIGSAADITCTGDVTIGALNGGFAVNGSLTVNGAENVTVSAASGAPTITGIANITCDGDVTLDNTGTGLTVSGPLTVTGAKNVSVSSAGSNPTIFGTATIDCTGDVTITNAGNNYAVGNGLKVSGAKNVTVTSASTAASVINYGADIACTGDVTIKALNGGFAVNGGLTVAGAKNVTVKNDSASATAPTVNGAADITCTGDVTITNEGGNITVGGSLKVTGAKNVTITSASTDTPVIGSGANITCTGNVTIKALNSGFAVSGDLTVAGAKDVTVKNESSSATVSVVTGSADITSSGNVLIQNNGSNYAVNGNVTYTRIAGAGDYLVKTGDTAGSLTTVATKAESQVYGPETCGKKIINILTAYKDKPSFDPTHLFILDDEPVAKMSFRDVQRGAYYYDAVKWAVENGITTGKTSTEFDPTGAVTRAQAVTFLWRAAGCPKVNYFMKFTDLKPGAYYTEAVRWAVAMGITNGVDETHFAPDVTCTRAHIVSFLYRYAKASAIKTANPFTDVKQGAYYYDAVLWAVANGITGGTTATTFAPTDICNRAQVVTFLYRYMAK